MPQATFNFPAGFLWGAATAAHQVEGGNTNNNWAAWEAEPGRILNGDRSGLACDWWGGRWKEDLDRAAETGQNAHRMSIEWSRVQPTPDHWDEDALDHYREIMRGMLARGLTPMVTLHHFTDPLWFYNQGGWELENAPELFEKYVSRVVEALKEYVSLWVTINEPNVYVVSGYTGTDFPPGKGDMNAAFTVLRNLVRGHAAAYQAIKRIQKNSVVGIAVNYRSFKPACAASPFDSLLARFLHNSYNDSFTRALKTGELHFAAKHVAVPEAAGTQDFIGVNYYTRDLVRFAPLASRDLFMKRFFPKDALLSPTGFIAHVPDGMFEALRWANGYGLPIYITENGVEDAADELRPRYLVEHLHQVWRAANFNFPIKGYFHWSLVDNFEWERGWSQRFGLWGLDIQTQARIRRRSVDLYAEICRQNAISSDTVQRFAPEAYPRLFPEA
ncbi:glycosyl hydrolase family 1 [Longilinea arvoryzae]|uniref:Glycosyl hydrolase family 1 n=1 Tax=Longilinea arvoryzae TaxID=360412 RepID=A0A0S7BIK0_9CHLR|nr:glycoside hydrolase family 1 protein [Longilinea arvoryzae]GAP14002.1 glycosyl hydrolase family 1 [Longilinea arvoryzae]